MKNLIKSASIVLSFVLVLCLVACGNTVDKEGLWENATYLKDTELGEGAKTAVVEYTIGDDSITFTIHTDKETLGAALLEHALIEGVDGLYTKVNGVVADYNVDQSYWAFYINGEYATTGLDDTPITQGEAYSLVYTK